MGYWQNRLFFSIPQPSWKVLTMNVRTTKIKMGKKFLTSLTILSLAFSGQVALSTLASAAAPATLVTFESGDTSNYALGGDQDFGNNASSLSSTPPDGGSSGSLKSAKIVRGTETWSGTTFLNSKEAGITLASASHKTVTMNVYAPVAAKQVLLKLEDADDNTHSVEAYATSTTVVGWQTLTFNLAAQRSGTAAFNDAFTFNMASIFVDYVLGGGSFGTGDIYYFDDVAFNGATTPELVPVAPPVEVPPVEVPPVVVIDAAAVQAALKVATAQAALGSLLESNKPATLDQYRDASHFIASQSALVRVNAAVAKMSASDRAEMSKVMEIIKAENFIDRIANPLTRPGLTSTVLINAGLLSSSSSYKYSVLAGLQSYKESSLDSLTKIAAAIKAEIAKANYRKERTLEIKAKIAARQKR